MEGSGLDEVEGQAPDPEQTGADLGVRDAPAPPPRLRWIARWRVSFGGADDRRVALGNAQREHDASDVVDDGWQAEHYFVGLLAVVQETCLASCATSSESLCISSSENPSIGVIFTAPKTCAEMASTLSSSSPR